MATWGESLWENMEKSAITVVWNEIRCERRKWFDFGILITISDQIRLKERVRKGSLIDPGP